VESLKLDALISYAIILLPGFVSLRAYSLLIPLAPRELKEIMIDLLMYGSVNAALNLPILVAFDSAMRKSAWTEGAVLFSAFFLIPTLVGCAVAKLRQSELLTRLGFLHPVPKAWDYLFRMRRPGLILITLKDGRMVGGYFGLNSFASSFPNEEDMYVEKVCLVDSQSGQMIGFVPNSNGMHIKRSDCDVVEFINTE